MLKIGHLHGLEKLIKKTVKLHWYLQPILTKKKQLTIPNATAICISASRRIWKEALEIRNTSKIYRSLKSKVTFNSKSEAFDYIERIMESIIMAYTVLEAFVNEKIPDDFNYEHTNRKNGTTEVMDKQSIERWLSLNEKLSNILPLAIEIQSPKGSKCWHSYHKLEKIRNRIIHMKEEDRRPTGPEIPTLWHDLFKVEPPYLQATEMIDYFVNNMQSQPRWHNEYSRRST